VEIKVKILRFGAIAANATALCAALTLGACNGVFSVPKLSQGAESIAAPADIHQIWRASLMRAPLPTSGCFEASYPSVAWVRAACSTAPNLPPSVARESHSDFLGQPTLVAPNLISAAAGSFPSATITGETNDPTAGVTGKSSVYSLQINSNLFFSTTCSGVPNCRGWEQFVYQNYPTKGFLAIWDWTMGKPHPRGGNWKCGRVYCYYLSRALTTPVQSIAGLVDMSLAGSAAAGGNSIILSTPQHMYAIRKAQNDGIVDLAKHWQTAQFNVYGIGNSSIAQFTPGSTIALRLEADFGAKTAPACDPTFSYTGESNNLLFVTAPSTAPPAEHPSILFEETNVSGGGSYSCRALKGSGA
jgi:hypothetical protein